MKIVATRNFNGDIVIVPRTVLDEFFHQIPLNNKNFPNALWIDTLIGMEASVGIYDELDVKCGSIEDYHGGCDICVFDKNELFSLLSVSSNCELLDLFYKLDENPNIERCEIEPLGEISMLYELNNFKGTVSCIDYDEDEYEDLLDSGKAWLIGKIDGINTETNKDIHYVIKSY